MQPTNWSKIVGDWLSHPGANTEQPAKENLTSAGIRAEALPKTIEQYKEEAAEVIDRFPEQYRLKD
jgi:hypothetical protein